MKVKKEQTIVYRMLERLKVLRFTALLRSDFEDLGNSRQVSRGLNELIKQKKIVRIGRGIYAKAYVSIYTDKALIAGNGVDIAFREALTRLGVQWKPGTAEQAYNARKTTQVPVYNIVQLRTRFRRKISYERSQLVFEGKINAR